MLALTSWSNLSTAQVPNWAWAKSAGEYTIATNSRSSIATDSNGNIFAVGGFDSLSLTLGTFTLANVGVSNSSDIFIAKYDATGNVLWLKGAGGISTDYATGIDIDASGNILVLGEFKSPSITFGTTTLINSGSTTNDLFIVKYDINGNVVWAKSAGGSDDENGLGISTDLNDNIFITGDFSSASLNFGTTSLTNIYPGSSDIYIAKYDFNGNVLWAHRAGNIYDDNGNAVSTDHSGNVIMTGQFSNNISFGSTILNSNFSQDEIFIVKYDSNGNVLWAKKAGGSYKDYSTDITIDTSQNIFISGCFRSPTIAFGITLLTNVSTNLESSFIAKYDLYGNILWAKSSGGSNGLDYSKSISSDVNGNVYLTGNSDRQTITFGSTTLNNSGFNGDDVYIVKYDTNGNVLWATSLGGTYQDQSFCIETDPSSNLIITGSSSSPTITFGNTSLTNGLLSNRRPFIAKLGTNTVGLDEIKTNSNISIAPNPFTSETTITFSDEQKNTTIKIIDVIGKEIKSISFSGKQLVIEKGEMKPGIYLVQAINENQNVETKKIVIQ
jgi:hypothetical protein